MQLFPFPYFKMEYIVLIFLVLFGSVSLKEIPNGQDIASYKGYQLLELYPSDLEGFDAAKYFATHNSSQDKEIITFKPSRGLNDSLDLLVAPSRRFQIEDFAFKHKLGLNVKSNDYSKILEKTFEPSARRTLEGSESFFQYKSYNAILDYLETLETTYPNRVKVETLGHSYENRPIKLVKISEDFNAKHPIILIDAGAHAREWAAVAMGTYLIHRLLDNPDSHSALKGVDWNIIPLVNPDGYEYSRTSDRLWRKNRSQRKGSECYGVDINRNYGYKWGLSGVSKDPCDEQTYAGPEPFSEIESQLVRNAMTKYSPQIKVYVSLHAYGNYLVYPWGYSNQELPSTWKTLENLARRVSDVVFKDAGGTFTVMSAGKWYAAAGGSDDYAFSTGIPIVYTMELTQGFEFTFPEENLGNVLPKYFDGLAVFAEYLRENQVPRK